MSIDHATEFFRPIPGFSGYMVSNHGRVLSQRKRGPGKDNAEEWRFMSPGLVNGYAFVRLIDVDGKSHNRFIHTLVLETFIGARPGGMQCRHLDGDRVNNFVGNLQWGTALENAQDKHRHGRTSHLRGEDHPSGRLTESQVMEIRQLIAQGIKLRVIAERFGIAGSTVSGIKTGFRWGHLSPHPPKENI